MNTASDDEQTVRLLSRVLAGQDTHPGVVLVTPFLEEVQEAIALGSSAVVHLRWTTFQSFRDLSIVKKELVVRSVVNVEEVELTHVSGLEIGADGGYSFNGAIIDFWPWTRPDSRGYRATQYKVSIGGDDGLRTYEQTKVGHGTAFDGQEIILH